MNALVLVDIQNDFLPGGALEVKEGDKILPIVNALLNENFDLIVATKDWHPENHASFAKTQGKLPGEHVQLGDVDQILWPNHCVQGSQGAELAPGWRHNLVKKVFHKGTHPLIDSYSTFFDNAHLRETGLEKYLKEKKVNKLFFAGLATDYCVKYSVLDAIQLGFESYVIIDACRAVNLQNKDEQAAIEEMQRAGAHIITSIDVKQLLNAP